MSGNGVCMPKRQTWHHFVDAFGARYSRLGKEYAEELLTTLACHNMQQSNFQMAGASSDKFRNIRRNMLMCWKPGWLKSDLLERTYQFLKNSGKVKYLTTITPAVMFGSVNEYEPGKYSFVPPQIVQYNIILVGEVGQLSLEMQQSLLDVLEQGHIDVSMLKLNKVSEDARKEIMNKYPNIRFTSGSSFEFHARPTFIMATYERKYLLDKAFTSRFSIMSPNYLDVGLLREIDNAPEVMFHDDHILHQSILYYVFETTNYIKVPRTDIPEEIYGISRNLSPRVTDMVCRYIAAKRWWETEPTKEEVIGYAKKLVKTQDALWSEV